MKFASTRSGAGRAPRRDGLRGRWLGALLLGALPVASTAEDAQDAWSVSALKRLSLEELADIDVTSVAKRAEPLSRTPAAVQVITGEDVLRSGVTALPEALRWVPGLQVGRIDSHTWGVGARGFNDVFANKLLVLLDGRSLYTPLYSGVYWNLQDVVFEDLDRIEVVRGPGATLWGANAVNGVINVTTKSSAETQGFLASAGGGNLEPVLASARYGGRISDTASYRVYGKFTEREDFRLANGAKAEDEWRHGQGGFRVDWDPSDESSFVLQGDGYANRGTQFFDLLEDSPALRVTRVLDASEFSGGNVLGRWVRRAGDDSELQLQAYYDRFRQDASYFTYDLATVDVDGQYRFAVGAWNEATVGAGYRRVSDELAGSFNLSLVPPDRHYDLVSMFVQDEVRVIEDRLSLFLGTKAEHNDFTGFEVQPGARLSWRPADRHTVWVSAARAVRTPSRAEADVRKPLPSTTAPPGVLLRAEGADGFESEDLMAWEIGYRVRPATGLTVDATAFFNDYDDLRTVEPGAVLADALPRYLIQPFRAANLLEGRAWGVELAVGWQVSERWRLRGGYSYLDIDLDPKPGSNDVTARDHEGSSPEHQWFVVSQWDLPYRFSVDALLRWVDRLETRGIDAYAALDLRVAWQASRAWQLSVAAQNLTESRHAEFGGSTLNGSVGTEVPRSVVGRITWRY